jgi:hypothetical protein
MPPSPSPPNISTISCCEIPIPACLKKICMKKASRVPMKKRSARNREMVMIWQERIFSVGRKYGREQRKMCRDYWRSRFV